MFLSRRRQVALVLGSILIAQAAFAFLVYPWLKQSPAHYLEDKDAYVEIARHFAAGHGYALDPGPHPTLRRMPAYPVFLALLIRILGDSWTLTAAAQLALAGVACLWIYGLARRVDHRAGLAAMALFGLYPLVLVYIPRYYSEILLLFFISGGLYFLQRFLESRRRLDIVAAAALTAGAYLTRASAIGWVLPAALLLLLRDTPRSGRGYRDWLAGAAVFLACLLPWGLRNMTVAGSLEFGSTWNARSTLHGWRVMTDPRAERMPREIDHDAMRKIDAEMTRRFGAMDSPRKELAEDRAAWEMYRHEIASRPLALALNGFRGLFRLFFLTSSPGMRLILGAANLFLALLALAGWALPPWPPGAKPPWINYLWLLLGVFYGLHTLIFPMVRYLLPAVPALAVLGGIGVDRIRKRYCPPAPKA